MTINEEHVQVNKEFYYIADTPGDTTECIAHNFNFNDVLYWKLAEQCPLISKLTMTDTIPYGRHTKVVSKSFFVCIFKTFKNLKVNIVKLLVKQGLIFFFTDTRCK